MQGYFFLAGWVEIGLCILGPLVQPLISANQRLNFIPGFFISFVQKPVWDNCLHSLLSLQSQDCRQKNYTESFFKTFRTEIKFHTNPGLS